MNKLNILFFVPWITKGKGGTENVGSSVANEMSRRGHKVTIATFDKDYNESKWTLDNSVDLIYLKEKIVSKNDYLNMTLSVSTATPDIMVGLHMNREFFKYIYCAYKCNIPIILSEHINPYFPRKIGNFNRDEREFIFSAANHIHLISKDFVSTLPIDFKSKISVINNTVKKCSSLASPKKNTDKNILTVCRLVPRKQVNLLIESFSALTDTFQDWTLNIVGYGDQENRLKELVSRLRISDRVKFIGQLDDPYPYYADANFFVLASETEGFPLTSLEAMQHGLPVIGFEGCSGLNEQVIHQHNGLLCDDQDPINSLSTALKTYMQDADLRAEHGSNALKVFSENYSNTLIFDQWENMIIDVSQQKSNSLYSYENKCRDAYKESALSYIQHI